MACLGCLSICPAKTKSPQGSACSPPSPSLGQSVSVISSSTSASHPSSRLSLCTGHSTKCCFSFGFRRPPSAFARFQPVEAAIVKPEPLKIMISGAPASGKGTQCELIGKKFRLVHIAAGDLLRAEVDLGTENGKRAKEYMEKGQLVPDEIVVMMVRERLLQTDAQENGWLLDGYPRSFSQAKALEDLGIRPDLFILLDVSENSLVERVVGRRLDPVTGKIYHLKYSPPENEEIAARLIQRFDDTEEKVKLRLQTYHQNLEAVLGLYKDVLIKVDGNVPKEDVFVQIDAAISAVLEKKRKAGYTSMTAGVAQ